GVDRGDLAGDLGDVGVGGALLEADDHRGAGVPEGIVAEREGQVRRLPRGNRGLVAGQRNLLGEQQAWRSEAGQARDKTRTSATSHGSLLGMSEWVASSLRCAEPPGHSSPNGLRTASP